MIRGGVTTVLGGGCGYRIGRRVSATRGRRLTYLACRIRVDLDVTSYALARREYKAVYRTLFIVTAFAISVHGIAFLQDYGASRAGLVIGVHGAFRSLWAGRFAVCGRGDSVVKTTRLDNSVRHGLVNRNRYSYVTTIYGKGWTYDSSIRVASSNTVYYKNECRRDRRSSIISR